MLHTAPLNVKNRMVGVKWKHTRELYERENLSSSHEPTRDLQRGPAGHSSGYKRINFRSCSGTRTSWSVAGGPAWWLSQNVEVARELSLKVKLWAVTEIMRWWTGFCQLKWVFLCRVSGLGPRDNMRSSDIWGELLLLQAEMSRLVFDISTDSYLKWWSWFYMCLGRGRLHLILFCWYFHLSFSY